MPTSDLNLPCALSRLSLSHSLAIRLPSKYRYGGSGWKGISDEAKQFVQALLRKGPAERMTAPQALQHPWLVRMRASEATSSPQSTIKQNMEVLRALGLA